MYKDIWICIEKGENNCSAFAPEVPGCIATDATVEATKERMICALESHIELMLDDGDPIDGITGSFPAEAVSESNANEYFCRVHVNIAHQMASILPK